MTQLQVIENFADMIGSADYIRFMFCEWLEDINFHSECAKLAEGYFNPKKIDYLQRLQIVANKGSYTNNHYKYLKDNGYIDDEVEANLETLRQEKLIWIDHGVINWSDLSDLESASTKQKALSYVFGWGVENDLSKDLVEKLENVIKKITEKHTKQAQAYAMD